MPVIQKPKAIFKAPYAGGDDPYIGDLTYELVNLELTFIGFNTDEALIEVLPVGGDPTDGWKEVTLETTETALRILQSALVQVRISGLATGEYFITAFQF